MKVLIACEFSGIVRDAFAARGHDAWSCDLLPSERPGKHILGDVLQVLDQGWDLMIAHPPCTYLAVSGARWFAQRMDEQGRALEFVAALLDAPIARIALENPIGVISTRIRKPDQIIQPWQFGHDASKATCLWLNRLPGLIGTCSVQRPAWIRCPCCEDFWCQRHKVHTSECPCPSIEDWPDADPYRSHYANQTPSGQNRMGPSPNRAADRSRTFTGIAEAMAEQWGVIR